MSNWIEQPREPLIPDMSSAIFSRQWYAPGGWKLDEPTLMIKVDTTRQKIGKVINRVVELGTDDVIPVWLYSSLDERLTFLYNSIGVYETSMDMVRDSSSGFDAIRYVDKYHQIYPSRRHSEKLDWDNIILGDKQNGRGICAVMPSMQTVRWLNEVNSYCNRMEEWGNGTYLQTKEKLEASKQFLKNIHAKWTGS